jgi:hypothetical protein
LNRAFDDSMRAMIDREVERRRAELPVPAQIGWHASEPTLEMRSEWISLFVSFAGEQMAIDAEMSMAARLMATPANRRRAVDMIDGIAKELGL